jgi:hypothetical protein
MRRAAHVLAALLLLAGVVAAKKPKKQEAHAVPQPPAVDSVTVALWSFDENGGPIAGDSGPFRMTGTAAPDARTDFGRYRSARIFNRTQQSFVIVPPNPMMNLRGPLSIEAWVYINSWSNYEMQMIAARWSPVPGDQSWVFGVSGLKEKYPVVPQGPELFAAAVLDVPATRLVFAMQPAEAASMVSFASVGSLPQGRWVHVAATADGEAVRLYIDGRMDSQFATRHTPRASLAPIVFGGFVDPRRISDQSGHMQIDGSSDYSSFYGFDGAIDEVRLSSTARARFESAGKP